MTEIFGDFEVGLPASREFLTIEFSPSSLPIQKLWKNNGLSADFMADYFATFFPTEEESDGREVAHQAEVKDAVSYIANELLENAMKYGEADPTFSVSLTLQLHKDRLVFLTRNSISTVDRSEFSAAIAHIVSTEDLGSLYEEALLDESGKSGLGFLTMIMNYGAVLGWQFEGTDKEGLSLVTTMVQVAV
ncbi:MAG: ATP-binding protein [Oscillatoriales cyanobacterium SM2_1_8]|nr:ATP-binding protein [Oscillatoriales cyanobacterium SM2_1_8]